jgi:hypothetical protein
MKPLSKGTTLLEKWSLLKAKLNHETAFKDMDIFENDDDKTKPDTDPSAADAGASKPEAPQSDESDDTSSSANEQTQLPTDENVQQPAEGSSDDAGETPSDTTDDEGVSKLEGDELTQSLKEHGYSDVEIAHILEGVTPKPPGEDEQDYEAHKQNLSQDDEGHGQTLGHRDQIHDVDLEHKKKLNDLELEYTKREKEMRLKHLEEELELKRAKLKASAQGDSK